MFARQHQNNSNIQRVNKGWGYELIFANTPFYCGKILHFNTGKKTSMHFHAIKTEAFYAYSGQFIIRTIDTETATQHETILNQGDKFEVLSLMPHQIESITEGDIFEASTHDEPSDSYRVDKGASQENNVSHFGDGSTMNEHTETSTSTGSLCVTGGDNLFRRLHDHGIISDESSVNHSSTSTGALHVSGGVGVPSYVYRN